MGTNIKKIKPNFEKNMHVGKTISGETRQAKMQITINLALYKPSVKNLFFILIFPSNVIIIFLHVFYSYTSFCLCGYSTYVMSFQAIRLLL